MDSRAEQLKQSLKNKLLFPFLLPVFFVLHLTQYFYGAISAVDALEMIAIFLAVAFGIYFLLRVFVKNRLALGLATTLLLGLFLYWLNIILFTNKIFKLEDSYTHYPIIVGGYLLITFLLCLGAKTLGDSVRTGLLRYLNTLFLIFVLVETGLLGYDAIHSINKEPLMILRPEERAIDERAKAGGNIYLLLFDEYASTASLKEYWGRDNSAIDSFLRARGFFVAEKSRSNYCWTPFSMASLLNLDYFSPYRKGYNYVTDRDQMDALSAIKNARLARILKQAGYSLKVHSVFALANQPKQDIPDIWITGKKLITVNTLYNMAVRDYLPYLRYRAVMKQNRDFHLPVFYRMDDYNNDGVKAVLDEARTATAQPKFVYAHFLMPHSTYYYDSTDHLMPMDRVKAITHDQEPRFYWYNLLHTNKRIYQMADTIIAHDPKATIIVLGDHGYRFTNEGGKHPEYFRNMCAIRFPDGDYHSVPETLTTVNVFRIVLNKVCGTSYPLLPDSTYTLEGAKGLSLLQ